MCLNSLIVVLVTHYDIVKDNNAVCKGIIPFETLLALSPLSLLKQQNVPRAKKTDKINCQSFLMVYRRIIV